MLKMGNNRRRNKAEIKAEKAAELARESQQQKDREELERFRAQQQEADLLQQSNAALKTRVEELINEGTLRVNEYGGLEKAQGK